ncbi:hypothetical protein F4560_008364 [Saccharothrix ecbatanensis]|uniref:DUF3558 domain-containing protein n=1 Tax=Saccharothrix ecbatanensis TaxID=1105145 RepID=A0A7W9HV05_9PSEU|nr:hypothetical protein [Saccharothrix ecbatanensis]MBB5808596.1 hypothetical protein [Saccharothrix ecbatanensis]
MRLRRVSALTTAALSLGLVFGLTACATQVDGKPVAAAGASAAETTSGKPSSTKSSATASRVSKPPTSAVTTSGAAKPSGDIKITTKKKTDGYDVCEILTPEEVAAAVGSTKVDEKGCLQSTEEPFSVVLFMLAPAEQEGEPRVIEVGGNTAYEVKQEGECTILVMLTDDPDEFTPAFMVSVTPLGDFDACEASLKLATTAFGKIPNA